MSCYTSNFQHLGIELRVVAKFLPEYSIFSNSTYNLYHFYTEYGNNWYKTIENNLLKIILDTCSQFNSNFINENRITFKESLFSYFNSNFTLHFKNILTVNKVVLGDIYYDPLIENGIEEKLLTEQNLKLLYMKESLNIIKKETDILVSKINYEISSLLLSSKLYYENTKFDIREECWNYKVKNDIQIYSSLDYDIFLSKDQSLIKFIYFNEFNNFTPLKYSNFEDVYFFEN